MTPPRRAGLNRMCNPIVLSLLTSSLACAVGWSADFGDLLKKSPLPIHLPSQLPGLPTSFTWPKDPDGVSTSLVDAYPASKHLPYAFSPDEAPAVDARLASDGRLVIGTGHYDFHLRSYCLHAGMFRPRSSGDGYLLAPLERGRNIPA